MSSTLIQQINRKLAAKGQFLATTRRWMRTKPNCGPFCILDLSGNVTDTNIDPEELARKLRVLKEGRKDVERSCEKKTKS